MSVRKPTHPATATLRAPEGTDELLQRIYLIAEDLSERTERGIAAQRARRGGRRIMLVIDELDDLLGLGN